MVTVLATTVEVKRKNLHQDTCRILREVSIQYSPVNQFSTKILSDYDMDSQLDQPIYGAREEHSIYGTSRRLSTIQRRQPKVDFPPPPPNPAYITSDDISPYHDTGYRSISDYYGSGHSSLSPPASYQPSPNMIYGSSMYGAINGSGGSGGPVDSIYDTSRKTSSIYSYGNIGLSKKGLLQIDYSCSWDDLDRMIGRTIYE